VVLKRRKENKREHMNRKREGERERKRVAKKQWTGTIVSLCVGCRYLLHLYIFALISPQKHENTNFTGSVRIQSKVMQIDFFLIPEISTGVQPFLFPQGLSFYNLSNTGKYFMLTPYTN
jgi:hypothetical protein